MDTAEGRRRCSAAWRNTGDGQARACHAGLSCFGVPSWVGSEKVDQHATRDFMQGLFLFKWQTVPESTGVSFVWHFALIQLLMVYFPFGKMPHTIGSLLNKRVMWKAGEIGHAKVDAAIDHAYRALRHQ